MKKEKVQNSKGEIIEVEIISEEESRILIEQSNPKGKITLQDALAKGHVPLEDFIRDLINGNHQ